MPLNITDFRSNQLFYSFALLLLIWQLFIGAVSAEESKPVIAIKAAKIGEGISQQAAKNLNLTTMLDEMEAAVQKNRKFTLVSRKQEVLQELREEQEFANSEFAAGNAANTGQLKNANFLILPTVQDFKFSRSSSPIPNLENKYVNVDSGMLEVNAQVLDTSTGGIKTTFYLKASFSTEKQIVNNRGGVPNSIHFTNMAKKVAAQMTDQLVDAVFPMKIININGKQVFINRGKDGGLKVGEVLKVFRPGEILIDPDTGENLGSMESEVGLVKVDRINPKFTIAIITKEEDGIRKGDIVRQ